MNEELDAVGERWSDLSFSKNALVIDPIALVAREVCFGFDTSEVASIGSLQCITESDTEDSEFNDVLLL